METEADVGMIKSREAPKGVGARLREIGIELCCTHLSVRLIEILIESEEERMVLSSMDQDETIICPEFFPE